MAERRENVGWVLTGLGGEGRANASGAILDGYGKHYVMVSFQDQ